MFMLAAADIEAPPPPKTRRAGLRQRPAAKRARVTGASWWANQDRPMTREEFQAQADAESRRMNATKQATWMGVSDCDRWSLPAAIWIRRQKKKWEGRRASVVDQIEEDDANTDDVDELASKEL